MNTPQIILKNVDCLDHLKQMVSDGITLLNSTIATQEYHDEFMAFQFVQTNGMTNEQLWELFCKAPIERAVSASGASSISTFMCGTPLEEASSKR